MMEECQYQDVDYAIKVVNVCKGYALLEDQFVLKNLNLSLEAGSM
jgi:hypothetical protein